MIGLQQVEAKLADFGIDAADIVRAIEGRALHCRFDRLADAMGRGTAVGGDTGQRSGFPFALAFPIARSPAHQQGVLTAVHRVGDFRHGEIEKIYRYDAQGVAPLETRFRLKYTPTGCRESATAESEA